MIYGRVLQFLRLQVMGQEFSIKYSQLVQYLRTASVTLYSFWDYISTHKIKHPLQCAVTWKYTLDIMSRFRHL